MTNNINKTSYTIQILENTSVFIPKDSKIVNLKYGYVKLNTEFIPKIIEKTKCVWNSYCLIDGNIYIKTPVEIDVDIGGVRSKFMAGEYFIPKVLFYHGIRIVTDISKNEDIEIYYNCILDKEFNYIKGIMLLPEYYIICDKIYRNREEFGQENIGVFKTGMCDVLPEYYFKTEDYLKQVISNKDCCFLQKNDCRKQIDSNKIKINSYTQFIRNTNVGKIQKDEDVTKFLIYYDKDYVRKSYPPCIEICYFESDYESLKKVLKEKYNVKLIKPQADQLYENKSYEEIYELVYKYNIWLDKCNKSGICNFISVIEIPFTKEYYNNHFKNKQYDNPKYKIRYLET